MAGSEGNFQTIGEERGCFHVAFDTHTRFPIPIFEHIATLFPDLAFECECIADDRSSIGYGWINGPVYGEPFRDRYPVPRNQWTTGSGHKRPVRPQRRHDALVTRLIAAARDAA